MHLVFRPLRLLQSEFPQSEGIFPVGRYLLKRKAYIWACSDKAPGLHGAAAELFSHSRNAIL
jgi:hypothetical protein